MPNFLFVWFRFSQQFLIGSVHGSVSFKFDFLHQYTVLQNQVSIRMHNNETHKILDFASLFTTLTDESHLGVVPRPRYWYLLLVIVRIWSDAGSKGHLLLLHLCITITSFQGEWTYEGGREKGINTSHRTMIHIFIIINIPQCGIQDRKVEHVAPVRILILSCERRCCVLIKNVSWMIN